MRKLIQYANGCILWEMPASEAAGAAPVIASMLAQGHLLVLRSVPGIREIRDGLIAHAGRAHPDAGAELRDFYASGRVPAAGVLQSLLNALKAARNARWISQQLAAWLKEQGFASPTLLDGGVNRLVLPAAELSSARASRLFEDSDFERARADGPVESFMPQPSNIHRDFNREHSVLMCNLWFPLHALDAGETLKIFPEVYRQEIYDLDNTAENQATLGAAVQVALDCGDALLFHGEHMHCSPLVKPGGRRHSFDLRIAAHCPDDNAHYRYNFWNLENFLPPSGAPSVELGGPSPMTGPMARHRATHGDRLSANFYCVAMEKDAHFNDWSGLLDVFRSYPFAEDRYLWAAGLAQARGAPEYAAFATEITGRSSGFFWVVQAARLLERANGGQAAAAWRRALEMAGNAVPLPNFAPIRYRAPLAQLTPDGASRIARDALAGHTFPGALWRRLRRVLRQTA